MALIKCPECGKEVSEHAKNCPNCGFAVEDHLKELVKKTMVIITNIGGSSIYGFNFKDENGNNLFKLINYNDNVCLLNYTGKKLVAEIDGIKDEIDIASGEKNFINVDGEKKFLGKYQSVSLSRRPAPTYSGESYWILIDCSTKKIEKKFVNVLKL